MGKDEELKSQEQNSKSSRQNEEKSSAQASDEPKTAAGGKLSEKARENLFTQVKKELAGLNEHAQDVGKHAEKSAHTEKPAHAEKTVSVETHARLAAEFDNYMKRTEKEKAALKLAGKKEAVLEFLAFADELDAAKKSFEISKDVGLKTGFEMLYGKFQIILRKNGIEKINCIGKDFDAQTCDAVMLSEADTENKVLFEIQPGYKMNGLVIRHAKVAVSKLKEKQDDKEKKDE